MSKLRRLMFLQGQRCFFCEGHIPPGEESIEHLVPVSDGGTDRPDNVVACCKTLNTVFGGISIKDKFSAVLKQRGKFVCPRVVAESRPKPPAALAASRPQGMSTAPGQSLGLVWPDEPAA